MSRRTMLILVVVLMIVGVGLWLFARGLPGLPASDTGETGGSSESGGAVPAETSTAVIEYVHDGDTLFLDDGRKVRLLGIDTPEIGENAECWGEESTMLLRSLLPEGTIVQVLADEEPLDQYGRSLLFVFTDDATNINLELVRRGAAEVVYYAPNDLFQSELRDAETQARDAGRGLWGACG